MKNKILLWTVLFILTVIQADANPPPSRLRPVTVPSVELAGLSAHHGKYLTVYYAVGFRQFLVSRQQETLQITRLKEIAYLTENNFRPKKYANIQIDRDKILFPKNIIPREVDGFNLAYNLVLFVVHQAPNFSLLNFNANGVGFSYPEGETPSSNHDADATYYLTKSNLESLLKQAQGKEPLQVQFGQLINDENPEP